MSPVKGFTARDRESLARLEEQLAAGTLKPAQTERLEALRAKRAEAREAAVSAVPLEEWIGLDVTVLVGKGRNQMVVTGELKAVEDKKLVVETVKGGTPTEVDRKRVTKVSPVLFRRETIKRR